MPGNPPTAKFTTPTKPDTPEMLMAIGAFEPRVTVKLDADVAAEKSPGEFTSKLIVALRDIDPLAPVIVMG